MAGFTKVFCSYSREDAVFHGELCAVLEAEGVLDLIEFWHDPKILAGHEFDCTIRREVETADVFILLLSKSFLESDYILRVEAKRALERAARYEALIVPVNLGGVEDLPEDLSALEPLNWLPGRKTGIAKRGPLARTREERVADFKGIADRLRQIASNRNHVIVPDATSFPLIVRRELHQRRDLLGIGRVHSFVNALDEYDKHYGNLLEAFLLDGVRDNCLFTIYPDESAPMQQDLYVSKLIGRLIAADKRLICFESGTGLLKAVEKAGLEGRNPVCVISTDHRFAAMELIALKIKNFLQSADGDRYVLMLPGPQTRAAIDRGAQYHDFFSELFRQQYVPGPVPRQSIVTVAVNPAPEDWLHGHEIVGGTDGVFAHLCRGGGPSHICIICANDDMALKVLRAYEEFLKQARSEWRGKILLVGFDGTDQMIRAASSGKPVATMQVDLQGMAAHAVTVLATRPFSIEPYFFIARVQPPR